MLAMAVLVLGSTVYYVFGLADSGITWTDGQAAYGVPGAGDPSSLPPGLSNVVGMVLLLAFFFGPLLMVPIVFGAAWQLRSSWQRRSSVDIPAVATLIVSSALVVLLVYWGDELWVWALD